MKTITRGKRLACVLWAVILLITGCGGADGSQSAKGHGEGEAGKQQTVKGRYAETEADLPGQPEGVSGMFRLPGGKLVITCGEGGLFVSEDGGVSWKSGKTGQLERLASAAYIMDVKPAPDGNLGIIYMEPEEEQGDDLPDSMSAPVGALLTPEEELIPVVIPGTEEGASIDRFWISDEGRYFVTTVGETIYEVKADGSSERYLVAEGSPQSIQFLGSLMIIDGYDFREPLLYDMEQEMYVEDEVLAGFVREHYGDRGFNGGRHTLCFFPGEEGVLYLAGEKGLHRHVVGGAAIEQVIDGQLSRLGNPQYGIAGMAFMKTGEFLAVSAAGKLIRFTYDPDLPAVPEEKLKIYSLTENNDIRTAASFYQIQNPDILIEYEIGMEEGSAVTREDAIKKLNAQIMAGDGPDLLALDGLPMESYIEKGVLRDLSRLVNSMEGEVFENLVCALGKEDRVYAVPGQVKLPVVMGREDDIAGMAGLADMADRIERIRRANPGKDLLGLCSEKAVLKICAASSAQEWKTESGEINREGIADFLVQARRVYEAQMEGLAEEGAEKLRQTGDSYIQQAGEGWVYDLSFYGFSMDYAAGDCRLFVGINGSPSDYIYLTSIQKAEDMKNTVLAEIEDGVFVPEIMLGINAASAQTDAAEEFVKLFLGRENQRCLSGYPVNRAAFEEALVPEEEKISEDGGYGVIGMIDDEGREFMLALAFPAAEETAALREWVESAAVPYREDRVLEACVFEEGSAYLLGERGIEETLEAIERQLAIYVAE